MNRSPCSARRMGCQMMSCSHCFGSSRAHLGRFTAHGLAYFGDGRFVAVNGVPSQEVFSIAGDRRTTSGFPGIRVSRTCWMGVWSNIFPGRLWDVANKLRF